MNPQAPCIIKLATSVAEIEQCFPVMRQLRPHITADNFVGQVQTQMTKGYQLVYVQNQEVVAVAGFNLASNLAWGKHLYVADLVVDAQWRSQGWGRVLFSWLVEYAQQHNCQQFHLDSGVQRFAAHRFYLQHKMNITSHHFSLKF